MTQKNGRMQKVLQLSLFVLSLATPCIAQETPAWELFGGYSFERSDVRMYYKSTPIIYTYRGDSVNLNGWDVSATENLTRWFGGTFDVSGHYKSPQLLGTTNQQRMYSILYGPRFFHRISSVTAFTHVLIGATHAKVAVTPTGPSDSELAFAMAAGGGLDLNLGKKAAFRLLKVEYFRANVLGIRQNSFRASVGVVFYLGQRK
jgi:hypothetical protein